MTPPPRRFALASSFSLSREAQQPSSQGKAIRKLLLAVLVALATFASALAVFAPASPAQGQGSGTWHIYTVTAEISSPQDLSRNLGLPSGRRVWAWDSTNQTWSDVALSSSLSAGTAVAFRGREPSSSVRTAQKLGSAENVTLTFNNGWNILRSADEVSTGLLCTEPTPGFIYCRANPNPPATDSTGSLELFSENMYDCSTRSGVLIVAALNLTSNNGNWRFAMPCFPSTLNSLIAAGHNKLTSITDDDALYIYFASALPINVEWDTNSFQPA